LDQHRRRSLVATDIKDAAVFIILPDAARSRASLPSVSTYVVSIEHKSAAERLPFWQYAPINHKEANSGAFILAG
jgi:hypothetical protein